MSFDYLALRDEMLPLIEEFGTTFGLLRDAVSSAYNEDEGQWTRPDPSVQTSFKGIMDSPSEEYAASVGQGSIQIRDMVIYMEGSVDPAMGDSVSVPVVGGTETWEIVNIKPVKPAEVAVLYIIQVRP